MVEPLMRNRERIVIDLANQVDFCKLRFRKQLLDRAVGVARHDVVDDLDDAGKKSLVSTSHTERPFGIVSPAAILQHEERHIGWPVSHLARERQL